MKLEDLDIYRLAREIAMEAWEIYESLSWDKKKVVGDQFITAVDSIGANIAEGWGRFHFPDKNKFNYNARGSLLEGVHWLELLSERKLAEINKCSKLREKLDTLHFKLNNYINVTKKQTKTASDKKRGS